jgi:ketosteroid isomerase-like protein
MPQHAAASLQLNLTRWAVAAHPLTPANEVEMRSPLLGAVVIAISTSVGAAQTPTSAERAVAALRTADSAWNVASLARNPDRMMAFYAPTAIADFPGPAAIHGAAAIRQVWIKQYTDSTYRLSWTLGRAELVPGTEIGYTIGTWREQKGARDSSGPYVAVWQRQPDGRWLVIIDTAR